jgi:hypothetical protein
MMDLTMDGFALLAFRGAEGAMSNKGAPEEFPIDEIDLLVGWRAGEDKYLFTKAVAMVRERLLDTEEKDHGAKGPLLRTWRKPAPRKTASRRRAPARARAHTDSKMAARRIRGCRLALGDFRSARSSRTIFPFCGGAEAARLSDLSARWRR